MKTLLCHAEEYELCPMRLEATLNQIAPDQLFLFLSFFTYTLIIIIIFFLT